MIYDLDILKTIGVQCETVARAGCAPTLKAQVSTSSTPRSHLIPGRLRELFWQLGQSGEPEYGLISACDCSCLPSVFLFILVRLLLAYMKQLLKSFQFNVIPSLDMEKPCKLPLPTLQGCQLLNIIQGRNSMSACLTGIKCFQFKNLTIKISLIYMKISRSVDFIKVCYVNTQIRECFEKYSVSLI